MLFLFISILYTEIYHLSSIHHQLERSSRFDQMYSSKLPLPPRRETHEKDGLEEALLLDLSPPRFAKGAVVLPTAARSTRPTRPQSEVGSNALLTVHTLTRAAAGDASIDTTFGRPLGISEKARATALTMYDKQTSELAHSAEAATSSLNVTETLGDVNLVTLQVCRASLLVAAAVAFVGSLGATVPNNLRLACAASGAACVLSMRFYTRLITLRRLPNCLGYRLESNAVAEAMRVANWTVVVAMLTWSALLLRGPYESQETTAGTMLLRLRYAQWRTLGPVLMGLTALMVIPVWHLFGLMHIPTATRCQRLMWIGLAMLCIATIALISADVYAGIVEPTQSCTPNCSQTKREQLEFVVLSCSLWIGYSILAVLRGMVRVGNSCMPMLRDPNALKAIGFTDERAERTADRALYLYNGSFGGCLQRAAQIGRHVYLGFATLSIRTYDANAMQRLAAWAEFGGPLPDTTHHSHSTHPTRHHPTKSPAIQGQPTDWSEASDFLEESVPLMSTTPTVVERYQTSLRTNEPELTQVCTQIFDSLLALLDVGTQALVAFGYATLTSAERE